ncbi:MAG: hypothetical protein PUE73_06765, partial [Eubacteriales bacterium]|nr:hypothetical protein [Eubacteriales bacterium]
KNLKNKSRLALVASRPKSSKMFCYIIILKNVRGRENLTQNKKGINRYRVKPVRTVMSTLFN